MTIEFTVPGMSCGHCAGTIAQALKAVDPQAQVDVDLGAKRVEVRSSAGRRRLVQALGQAGYPPAADEPAPATRGGCGCG